MSTDQKISLLIEDQLPDFIKSDHPTFVNFVKAYYEWMEQQSSVNYETRKLLDYADVDTTSEEFINHFKTKFLPYFPEDILCDKPKLIKTIREFYLKKGSEESLKFLFRVLYNQEIDVSYPKNNILKASDGKWFLPQSFKLTSSNTSVSLDLETLKKRRGLGTLSSASCVVESAYKTIDPATNQEIFEIFVSNVNRKFVNGENLEISYVAANGSTVYLFSETIIGSLAKINIDPNNRGLTYKTGDPVVIAGGLSNTNPSVVKAVASVGDVTSGSLQTINVTKGGYGFRVYANGQITVSNTATDLVGNGGSALISAIGSTETLNVYTDSINLHSSLVLSSSNLLFPNFATTNISTELWRAFSKESLTVGSITAATITDVGSNYNETPIIDAQSYYNTDTSYLYLPTISSNTANAVLWANTRQNILDLGKFAHVDVVRGGTGYNSSTDTITATGLGSSATFTFANNALGAITSVTVTNPGEGYHSTELLITTVAGSGANLVAYRYGEGDELTSTVDEVGRILNFNLTNRGSGYVSTPSVSLRIKDVVIAPVVDGVIGTILEFDEVYQGVSNTNYTFKGTVDSYNVSTSTIRVYDYSGTLSLSQDLRFPSFNAVAVSQTSYGNSQAKANAEFSDGLVKANGYFLTTDGFLSSDKKLQDSEKYHNFSYIIIAEKALESYRQALIDILHPSGMKMFGYNNLLNFETLPSKLTSNVYTSNSNNSLNTISATSFSSDSTIKLLLNFESELTTDSSSSYVVSVANNGPNLVTQNVDFAYFGSGSAEFPTVTGGGVNYQGAKLKVPLRSDTANLANTSWGLEGWFYINNTSRTENDIFYYGNDDGSGNNFTLSMIYGASKQLQLSGSMLGSYTSVKTNYLPNTWYHIALVHDSVTKKFRIYANGIFQRETAAYTTFSFPTTANLTIGGGHLAQTQGNYLAGNADEIVLRFNTIPYTANTTAGTTPYTVPTSAFATFSRTILNYLTIVGTNTLFTSAKANDLIVIDTSNSLRTQTKRILNIANATYMNVESQTTFVGDGKLTTQNGNNKVVISSNANQLGITSGDYLYFKEPLPEGGYADPLGYGYSIAKVQSIAGNIITTDYSCVTNSSAIVYQVDPYFNGVSYKIISTD